MGNGVARYDDEIYGVIKIAFHSIQQKSKLIDKPINKLSNIKNKPAYV